MAWAARFLIPRGRDPALAVLSIDYQPSNPACSADILVRGAKLPEKTAAAIIVPG
jgi:hypothetical protein